MAPSDREASGSPERSPADVGRRAVVRTSAADDEVRVRRIAAEARAAFDRLRELRRGVTIFGSAQPTPARRWGDLAREIGACLTEAGFTVITGGGPGLMAEANRGASESGGASVGLTIELPDAEPPNAHLSLEVPFHYFFLRKLALVRYSCAFVLLPGGFGTLDELFEALNLRRTHRLEPFPVILVGVEYWDGLVHWLKESAVPGGALSAADVASIGSTDDPGEVVRIVQDCHRALCRRLGVAQ